MNRKIFNVGKRAFVETTNAIRRIRHPEKYQTLSFFINHVLGDDVRLNEQATTIKDKVITQICTPGFWNFPKNCACLVRNGQDEADQAIKDGASVLITDKDYGHPCIISNNPLAVFAKLCRYYRDMQQNLNVTAITGSIGKTTTKSIIGTIYSSEWNTFFTYANENTYKTIGFATQHIPPATEKMVQEVNEANPNETQFLSEMLNPKTVVLTSIDKSHFARFGNASRIVEEVCSITKNMKDDGQVIVNIDEFTRFDLLNGRTVVTISTQSNKADFYAENVKTDEKGLDYTIVIRKTGEKYAIKMDNIYATHNVICATLAFAAAFCEGMEPSKIAKAISSYKFCGSRQNIAKTKDGIVIYADCYNAVGKSMKSAIEASDLIPIKGKRIAVLGDVEEAGDISSVTHQNIIKFVDESKFDMLLAIGENMNNALSVVSCRKSLKTYSFSSKRQLTAELRKMASPGDLVLFKSSHSLKLKDCIKEIWPKTWRKMTKQYNTNYNKYRMKSLLN